MCRKKSCIFYGGYFIKLLLICDYHLIHLDNSGGMVLLCIFNQK